MTFLWLASRISNGGTMAPPGNASILSWPPVSLSTRSAKNLKASWVVDDAGTADCIFSTRDCWASAGPASAKVADTAATTAALVRAVMTICCAPRIVEVGSGRASVSRAGQAYRGALCSARRASLIAAPLVEDRLRGNVELGLAERPRPRPRRRHRG